MKSEYIGFRTEHYNKEVILKICDKYKFSVSEFINLCIDYYIENNNINIELEYLMELRKDEKERNKYKTERRYLRSKMHFPARASRMIREALDDNCANEHIMDLIKLLEKESLTYKDDIIINEIKKLQYIDLTSENWKREIESQIKIIHGLKCEVELNDNNN